MGGVLAGAIYLGEVVKRGSKKRNQQPQRPRSRWELEERNLGRQPWGEGRLLSVDHGEADDCLRASG